VARSKAESFEIQRTTIRDVATRLFAAQGYASASVADLARACGVSKALMYHYYRDKEHLLADIAESYVERLNAIVDELAAERLPPAAHLRRLIESFMAEYENSAARHRVLVQDVKYLGRTHRARVKARERRVVQGFADVIARLAPGIDRASMIKPLTMILFGMINWTFTWFKERGPLSYADMAPVVADLFLGGVGRVRAPAHFRKARPARPTRMASSMKASA
jgi:AcrR family transcriptional regulator